MRLLLDAGFAGGFIVFSLVALLFIIVIATILIFALIKIFKAINKDTKESIEEYDKE